MGKSYQCKTCGVVSEDKSHLCQPKQTDMNEYCGMPEEKEGMMCEPMKGSAEYECDTCGRPAEKENLVCKPVKRH